MKASDEKPRHSYAPILVTFGLIIACLVIWYALKAFLLAFAASLLAVFFCTASRGIKRVTRLPYPLVLSILLLVIGGLLVWLFWVATPLVSRQLTELFDQLPQAYDSLRSYLSSHFDFALMTEKELTSSLIEKGARYFSQATALVTVTIEGMVSFILFFLVGIYLAFSPKKYLDGIMYLFPPWKQSKAMALYDRLQRTLWWWVVGKLISMVVIGILSGVGLWLMGVPLALILGVLAGLLAFIPYIGPIIASVPAILIALSQEPMLGLYVVLFYMAVHAVEGYFISPFVDQRTVSLPPAFTVLMQLLLVILIGFWGLALASPIAVVLVVLINELYVKRVNGQPVQGPNPQV